MTQAFPSSLCFATSAADIRLLIDYDGAVTKSQDITRSIGFATNNVESEYNHVF